MSSFASITPKRILLIGCLILGTAIFFLPRLRFELTYATRTPELFISYSFSGNPPRLVEEQVTAPLEGALSQIEGLRHQSSSSGYGGGWISLQFDENADLDMKQFEATGLIRRVYPHFREGVSFPRITQGKARSASGGPLLVYSVNASRRPYEIRTRIEAPLRKALLNIRGIRDVVFSGAVRRLVAVEYDRHKCDRYGVGANEIQMALYRQGQSYHGGSYTDEHGNRFRVQMKETTSDLSDLENLVVAVRGGHPVRLAQIASIYPDEEEPASYFRVNGRNTILFQIYAADNENELALSAQVRALLSEFTRDLPPDFGLFLEHDDTESAAREIRRYARACMVSLVLLLASSFLCYRNRKHWLVLVLVFLLTLALTVVIYALSGMRIHLYSLAGLSLAFGLMMGSTSLMLDQYRRNRATSNVPDLLASTLILLWSASFFFFLRGPELQGLAEALIVCLASSFVSNCFFLPAAFQLLIKTIPAGEIPGRTDLSSFRRIGEGAYFNTIRFLSSHRKTFGILLLLVLGLPVFLLPSQLEGSGTLVRCYNRVIGNERLQTAWKPHIDRWLGGSSYLFYKNLKQAPSFGTEENTRLFISAQLPFGSTPEQMNSLLSGLESYLSGVPGIEKFLTTIPNGQQGRIDIRFRPGFESGSYPLQLKSRIIAWTSDRGGVDWTVYGIGEAFSNAGAGESAFFRVRMKGYRYEELERQAGRLAQRLLAHSRIQKVNENDNSDNSEIQTQQLDLTLPLFSIAARHVPALQLTREIEERALPTGFAGRVVLNHVFFPLVVRDSKAADFSVYDLLHSPLSIAPDKTLKLGSLTALSAEPTADAILREDRQYIRTLSFEYTGARYFGQEFLDRTLKEFNAELPAGYQAEEEGASIRKADAGIGFSLTALLAAGIFVLSVILFEGFRLPLRLLLSLPVCFIGVFLAFGWSHAVFNQGGLASLLLTEGLAIQAGICLLSDHRRATPSVEDENLFLKDRILKQAASLFRTLLFCVCGLLSFQVANANAGFWHSFAVGALGGIPGVLFLFFVLLPVIFWKRKPQRLPDDSRF